MGTFCLPLLRRCKLLWHASVTQNSINLYKTSNRAALANTGDEGAHAPLLLSMLDLSHWTTLMNAVTTNKATRMIRLKKVQQSLASILDQDEVDMDEANQNTSAVEAYLRAANPHEEWTKDSPLPTVNLNEDASGD